MQVNTNLLVNLSCSAILRFLWLVPFPFRKTELIIFVLNDKYFGTVFIQNNRSTSWFVFRKFRNNKIRIDIERFGTVISQFFEKSVSLIIRECWVVLKLKNRINVIIPSFFSMITESRLVLFLFLGKIDEKFCNNWFVNLKLSSIAYLSLHDFKVITFLL